MARRLRGDLGSVEHTAVPRRLPVLSQIRANAEHAAPLAQAPAMPAIQEEEPDWQRELLEVWDAPADLVAQIDLEGW